MDKVAIGIILAGGKGNRLWPLTQKRSKPAVPIAGKFRLIDIPISNCLHSEIKKIFVVTQFNSESLNRHIIQTYSMPSLTSGFVQILAAQQTIDHTDWYQGTADAVRQNLTYLWDKHTDCYVILGGDHLYKMDYRKMIKYHFDKKADITIGVYRIKHNQTQRFGIIKSDPDGHVEDYFEKPTDNAVIERLRTPLAFFKKIGVPHEHQLLGSMGIYIFSRKALFQILTQRNEADFGGGIFPPVIFEGGYKVYAYLFSDYWEDIGTIKTFFNAMIELTQPNPRFDFYDPEMSFFTHPRFLPGTMIRESYCNNAMICEGSFLTRSKIDDSIIGIRSIVRSGSRLCRVIMMGADYYEGGEEYEPNQPACNELGIGENCEIEDAIIDKNAYIGNNVKILKENRTTIRTETEQYVIQDGIVIIKKNAMIPRNTIIQ